MMLAVTFKERRRGCRADKGLCSLFRDCRKGPEVVGLAAVSPEDALWACILNADTLGRAVD